MKQINIENIRNYKSFITRNKKQAIFLNYVPEVGEYCLIFLVEGNLVVTNREGMCYSVNSVPEQYFDTNYKEFDVFWNDQESGWINLYKNGDSYFTDELVYETYDEAKNNILKDMKDVMFIKTLDINWSVDDE